MVLSSSRLPDYRAFLDGTFHLEDPFIPIYFTVDGQYGAVLALVGNESPKEHDSSVTLARLSNTTWRCLDLEGGGGWPRLNAAGEWQATDEVQIAGIVSNGLVGAVYGVAPPDSHLALLGAGHAVIGETTTSKNGCFIAIAAHSVLEDIKSVVFASEPTQEEFPCQTR